MRGRKTIDVPIHKSDSDDRQVEVEPTFEAIPRRTVTQDAIAQIRNLVASGGLMPGQKLPPERRLAEMLGVSRPTLREAIGALTAMGILESQHGSGTYVAKLSAELLTHPLSLILATNGAALQELFEVRLMLEVGAARWAAIRISDSDLRRLGELSTEARHQISNVEAFVDLDIAFHRVIHVASGNAVLAAVMESISILGKESRMHTAQRRDVREGTCREHGDIYHALEDHDSDAAAEAMKAHLQHVRVVIDRSDH